MDLAIVVAVALLATLLVLLRAWSGVKQVQQRTLERLEELSREVAEGRSGHASPVALPRPRPPPPKAPPAPVPSVIPRPKAPSKTSEGSNAKQTDSADEALVPYETLLSVEQERDELSEDNQRLKKKTQELEREKETLLKKARTAQTEQRELRDKERTLSENKQRLLEQDRELLATSHELAAVREQLVALEAELETAQTESHQNRQLYLLLRGICAEPQFLQHRRQALSTFSGSKSPAGVDLNRAEFATESAAEPPDAELEQADDSEVMQDPEHQKAARAARVMVKDLFLYNEHLLRSCTTKPQLRNALKRQYQGARDTFEGRVPSSVRQHRDYLELEFERALGERLSSGQPDAEARKQPDKATPAAPSKRLLESIEERRSAARLAHWLLADLVLSNLDAVEEGIRTGKLREALETARQTARQEYQEKVRETLWKKRHDFDLCFEEALSDLDTRRFLDSELDELLSDRFKEA